MRLLKRLFVALLILSVTNLYLPKITFAKQRHLFAKAGITKHKPEIRSTPEEDIPTIKKKKTTAWTWLILLALIGGAAAAACGGGGGDKDDKPPPPPDEGDGGDSGDVTVTW